jgi:hypothetical protein
MNKRIFASLLVLSLTALILLTACQSTIPVQAKADEPDVVDTEDSAFDYEAAADNFAFRWIAMARAYETAGLLNRKMDSGDLMAYRWNAMAAGYQRNGLLNYASNPDDVMAFRWLAMARYYEKHDMLTNKLDAGDIKAFRWLAMARAYERLGLLNEK